MPAVRNISQATVARAAGIAPSTLSRIERNLVGDLPLGPPCRAARALGLQVSVKLYPIGVAVRDAPQLALLARLESVLAAPLRLVREVSLPMRGDLRAWDGSIVGAVERAFIEAESRLGDVQALQRRVELKIRDDPRARIVILAVTKSDQNRRVLLEHREALRPMLPLDGAAVLRALRHRTIPAAGGIVLL
jgi:transcriptional regulator with XRE-family HTH domain